MSMPAAPDWYDDPDDPKAERWWDGHEWSPNRRRKAVPPTRSVQPSPSTHPPYSPDVERSAVSYPSDTGRQLGPTYAPTPWGPPGSFDVFAENRAQAGIEGGDSNGARVLGALIAVAGLAAMATAFATWAYARVAGYYAGADASWSVIYPGIGAPRQRGTLSDSSGSITVAVGEALDTTNPGWVALLFGALALAAAVVHLARWNRKNVAAGVAASGVLLLVLCTYFLADLRGAYGDPPETVNLEFSPGFGLWALTALAIVLAGLGSASFVLEQRAEQARI